MWRVLAGGMILGATVSALSLPLTGHREAFDASPLYYLTAMFFAGALATLPRPRFWWLAVVAIFFGEHIYYALVFPEMRPWFLFGLAMNAIMPTWWAAALGSLLVFMRSCVANKSQERTE